MVSVDLRRQYPKNLRLNDGKEVAIRLMEPGETDKSAILKFASGLTEDDLLYLRTDITDPAAVAQWIANVASGNSITVIADVAGEVAGYASVHQEPARWTRRVGELRVNAGPRFRGVGLGRALVAEVFTIGQSLGLKKLCGLLTSEQHGAQTLFERLGFRVEADLQDWVEDRHGRVRDILVMTYKLDGFTDKAAQPQR